MGNSATLRKRAAKTGAAVRQASERRKRMRTSEITRAKTADPRYEERSASGTLFHDPAPGRAWGSTHLPCCQSRERRPARQGRDSRHSPHKGVAVRNRPSRDARNTERQRGYIESSEEIIAEMRRPDEMRRRIIRDMRPTRTDPRIPTRALPIARASGRRESSCGLKALATNWAILRRHLCRRRFS
jgi:hypothetical protein